MLSNTLKAITYLGIIIAGLILIYVLVAVGSFFWFRYQLFKDDVPSNVEVIVPKQENVRDWALSPEGDKIIYSRSSAPRYVLLFPMTKQQHTFDRCGSFKWIDNIRLLCQTETQQFVLNTNDFSEIALQQVSGQSVDIQQLLNKGQIFWDKNEKDVIYVLNADRGDETKNYCIVASNVDNLLEERKFTTILPNYDFSPLLVDDPVTKNEPVSSPDGSYYYVIKTRQVPAPEPSGFLEIHRNSDDEILVEVSVQRLPFLEVGGWAADSSGVYFAVHPGGMFGDPRISIKKLKIPGE